MEAVGCWFRRGGDEADPILQTGLSGTYLEVDGEPARSRASGRYGSEVELGSGGRTVLEILAVAGHPVPAASLWAFDLLAEVAVDEALLELESAAALRWVDEAHVEAVEPAASEVRTALAGVNRARIRGALGRLLPVGGAVAEEVLVGHRLAGLVAQPDPEVVPDAVAAADRLQRRGDLPAAVAVYEAVLASLGQGAPAPAEAPVAVRVRLAALQRWSGDREAADALTADAIDLARRSGDPRLLAAVSLAWSGIEIAVDDDPTPVAIVDEALAAVDRATDPELAAHLLAQRAFRSVFVDLGAAQAAACGAVDLVDEVSEPEVKILCWYAHRITHWHPRHHHTALAQAERMIAVAPQATEYSEFGAVTRLQVFLEQGDFARFDREGEAMAQRLRLSPRPYERIWLEAALGARATVRGHWEAALQHSSTALSLGRGPDYQTAFQLLLGQQVLVAWQRGDDLSGLVGGDDLPAGPLRTSWDQVLLGWTAPVRPADEIGWWLDHWLGDGPDDIRPDLTWVNAVAGLSMAAAEIGAAEHAATLLTLLEPHLGVWAAVGGAVCLGPLALHAGRLATVVGRHHDADTWLLGAHQRCLDGGASAWTSRVALARSQITSLPEPTRRELAGEALELATALGQPQVVAGARAVLRQLGHTALPAGLTAREAEVLAHVARGATNREAAAALYLSVKTVERHLLNAYAKLGVRSRTEAAAFALSNGIAQLEPPGIQRRSGPGTSS